MNKHSLHPGGIAVGVFGADGRLRAHTGDLARLLGLPEVTIVQGQELAALIGQLTDAAPVPPCSLQCRTGDGRLLHLVAEALSDGGWSLAVIDETAAHAAAAAALREARETAEAGARAKARFLATMNHELRTPLNAVIGFAETLAHDAARSGSGPKVDPKETEEYALHIRDAGRHLLTLIDDILDLVRLDSGAYELVADTVDVGRLVQSALRGAAAAAQKGGLALTGRDETGRDETGRDETGRDDSGRAGSGGARLRGDERRLRRLLAHLIGNAVKFTPDGGRVTVTSRVDAAGDVAIEVHNTGDGMAAEDLQRALQPFHQLDARLARRAGGAGIGLQLSRAIAEAHGGALLLDSAPGRGTTATLKLPRTRRVEPSLSLQPAQESP
jgi:signal transduction histidine kinase